MRDRAFALVLLSALFVPVAAKAQGAAPVEQERPRKLTKPQIGRASCRERVYACV